MLEAVFMREYFAFAALAAALALTPSGGAQATVITFDELPYAVIPDGYGG